MYILWRKAQCSALRFDCRGRRSASCLLHILAFTRCATVGSANIPGGTAKQLLQLHSCKYPVWKRPVEKESRVDQKTGSSLEALLTRVRTLAPQPRRPSRANKRKTLKQNSERHIRIPSTRQQSTKQDSPVKICGMITGMQLPRSATKQRSFPPVCFKSNGEKLNSPLQAGKMEDRGTWQGGSSHHNGSHWLIPRGSFRSLLRQVTKIMTQKDTYY